MIFLTVGTQLPFDRLVKTVDLWAKDNPDEQIIGQIGKSSYSPDSIEFISYISHHKCIELMESCSLIISHAGMGTVLTALELCKPVVVMPRLVKYGEHRNDHQMATAKWINKKGIVTVAYDEKQLLKYLNNPESIRHPDKIGPWASDELIQALKAFID